MEANMLAKKKIRLNPMIPLAQAEAMARATWEDSSFGQEERRRLEEQQRRWANPEVGDEMPDGTIYAGISPDTNQPIYAAPADAPMSMDFNAAAKYATGLEVGGKKGFRVPSKAELNVLFQNREKGALKGTFNLAGSDPASWYWSGTPYTFNLAYCQRFSDGLQSYGLRDGVSSVRCVR